jgi:serine/threonine protein kinase
VLEDPGGETLDRFPPGPMEMTRFLRFAIGIATALSGLHEKGLIHKDVKPANVLVSPATGRARLMGFGIASRLPRERQALEPPCGGAFFIWSRIRPMMAPARSASPTTESSASLTSPRSGGCRSKKFRAARALLRALAIGCVIS